VAQNVLDIADIVKDGDVTPDDEGPRSFVASIQNGTPGRIKVSSQFLK